jgi:hypothetical protein
MVTQVIVGSVLILLGLCAIIGLPTLVMHLVQRPIRERARIAEDEIRKELASLHLRERARIAEDEIRKELASLHLRERARIAEDEIRKELASLHHGVAESNNEAPVTNPDLITPRP